MSAGIGDFRNAAQANTGALHLNAEGTGVVRQAPTSVWGKIVAWFRGAPDPGTTAQNGRVMNAFVRAIASDPKYGPEFADMAATQLSQAFVQGKGLEGRTVQTLLTRFDRQLGQVQGLNRTNAERFSKLDLHGDVHNFGKIFADVATEKGVQQSLAQFETSTLSKSIKQAIMDAGDGGKHVVTLEEAREIAEDKIGTFLDTKKALLDGLAEADVTEAERQAVHEDASLS